MTKTNRIIRKTLRIILGLLMSVMFFPVTLLIAGAGVLACLALMVQCFVKMYLDDSYEDRLLARVNLKREAVLAIRLAIWPITVWTDFMFGQPTFKITEVARELLILRDRQNR